MDHHSDENQANQNFNHQQSSRTSRIEQLINPVPEEHNHQHETPVRQPAPGFGAIRPQRMRPIRSSDKRPHRLRHYNPRENETFLQPPASSAPQEIRTSRDPRSNRFRRFIERPVLTTPRNQLFMEKNFNVTNHGVNETWYERLGESIMITLVFTMMFTILFNIDLLLLYCHILLFGKTVMIFDVYLIRHGESEWNIASKIRRHECNHTLKHDQGIHSNLMSKLIDPKLTKTGRRDANGVREWMKSTMTNDDINDALFVTSPLSRAALTMCKAVDFPFIATETTPVNDRQVFVHYAFRELSRENKVHCGEELRSEESMMTWVNEHLKNKFRFNTFEFRHSKDFKHVLQKFCPKEAYEVAFYELAQLARSRNKSKIMIGTHSKTIQCIARYFMSDDERWRKSYEHSLRNGAILNFRLSCDDWNCTATFPKVVYKSHYKKSHREFKKSQEEGQK